MRRVSLFLFLLILLAQIAGAQSLIIIDVHENGDALWTMEKRLPLANQTDIEEWEEFIKTGQGENAQDLEDFRKKIEWFLLSAQRFSSRPMKAENFKLSYDTAKNPSNAFGIVRYSFEWKNFSNRKDGKILISSRVPKTLRGAIAYHEKVEHRLMTHKKGKRKGRKRRR